MPLLTSYIVESSFTIVQVIIYSISLKLTYERYIAIHIVVVPDWFDSSLLLKFAINTINR